MKNKLLKRIAIACCSVLCFASALAFGAIMQSKDEVQQVKAETTGGILKFTALVENSSVTFNYSSATGIKTSTDGTNWIDYTKNTEITLANVNDYVMVKGSGITTNINNYFSMTGSIAASGSVTSLIDGVGTNLDIKLPENCFYCMFKNCSALTTAPVIYSKVVGNYSCCGIFSGCSNLTSVPDLLFQTIGNYGCSAMFSSCGSLISAPAMNSVTSIGYCGCQYMFSGCSKLETAPAISALTTVSKYGCEYMFNQCKALKSTPNMSLLTSIDNYGLRSMFNDCIALTKAYDLKAETTGTFAYDGMFKGCKALTTAPAISLKTIGEGVCRNMFYDCIALTTAPNMSAITSIGSKGCYRMFYYCSALTTVPDMSSLTSVDANGCYQMFFRCSKLTTAPSMASVTSASDYCFFQMYGYCSVMTKAPNMSSLTSIGTGSCQGMFFSCSKLTTAPAMNLKTIGANGCYQMFYGCTKLTTVIDMTSVTSIGETGCRQMFYNCTSLKLASNMTSVTSVGANGCYQMFYNCSKLAEAPVLSATTLGASAYSGMFSKCTSLYISTTKDDVHTKVWTIPNATVGDKWNENMFAGCTNVTITPTVNTTYYQKDHLLNVEIDETAQGYAYNGSAQNFEILGKHKDIGSFTVSYYVNNAYTTTAPTDIGFYKVKITRAEDATYKAYEKEIENGLIIKTTTIESISKEDSKLNVQISSTSGFNPNIELAVNITDDIDLDSLGSKAVSLVLDDEEIELIYEIKLVTNDTNTEVQPDAGQKVKVKILIPEDIDVEGIRKIIHIHSDNEAEEIAFDATKIDNGYYEFEVDSFSKFALVCEDTGSIVWLIILIVIVLAIAAVAAYYIKKYKFFEKGGNKAEKFEAIKKDIHGHCDELVKKVKNLKKSKDKDANANEANDDANAQ